jgi:RPAP1-like, C-terminal/RPAP1-like, N-terminal
VAFQNICACLKRIGSDLNHEVLSETMVDTSRERAFRRALPVEEELEGPPAATVLSARTDATPTSHLLPPVLERHEPQRRRRPRARSSADVVPRKAPYSSGFPVPSIVAVDAKRPAAPNGPGRASGKSESEPTGSPVWVDGCGNNSADAPVSCVPESAKDNAYSENDSVVAAMSQEEIDAQIAEVRTRLDPETFALLQRRVAAKRKPGLVTAPMPLQNPPGLVVKEKPSRVSFAKDEFVYFPSADVCPLDETTGADNELLLPVGAIGTADSAVTAEQRSEELAEMVHNVLSLRHVASALEMEHDKLAWTAATDDVRSGSVEDLDAAVRKSAEALGSVAGWRFDLLGRRLSEKLCGSLPVHLGLHHHGAEADLAGYTLGELLLLARSTVTGQRAFAFKVLGEVIVNHGDDVVEPLRRAGGIATLLAEVVGSGPSGTLDSARGKHNLSVSRSYIGLMAALLASARNRSQKSRENVASVVTEQLYFVSPFYVPPRVKVDMELPSSSTLPSLDCAALMDIVGKSSCVVRLVLIASAALAIDDVRVAVQALELCHFVVESCPEAGLSLARDTMSIVDLYKMSMFRNADGGDGDAGSTKGTFEMSAHGARYRIVENACGIISMCMLAAGWRGYMELLKGRNCLADSSKLAPLISTHVGVSALTGESLHEKRFELAKCALRVLRSALTFGLCLDVAAIVARNGLPYLLGMSIPRASVDGKLTSLAASDMLPSVLNSTCVDAYLALEGYAHALFADVVAVESANDKVGMNTSSSDSDTTDAQSEPSARIQFAREELQALIPVALEAATRFAGVTDIVDMRLNTADCLMDTCVRAAAGHFVATVLAMTASSQVFLSDKVVGRVFNVAHKALCSAVAATSQISSGVACEFAAVAVGCSFAHAGARLLPHADSTLPTVAKCVELLSEIKSWALDPRWTGQKGSCFVETSKIVVINSYAEWLGLQSRHAPTPQSARSAMSLLPSCADAQVAADMIARCILSQNVVLVLAPDLSESKAAEIVAGLLPRTLMHFLGGGRTPGAIARTIPIDDDEQNVLASTLRNVQELLSFWVSPACEALVLGCSFLRILRSGEVISPREVLNAILLGVPTGQFFSTSTQGSINPSDVLGKELMESAEGAGADIFPGGSKTALPSTSTIPPPALASKMLALAESLVEHGPCTQEASLGVQAVSSLLLTAMLRPGEADTTLRRELWRHTVLDCGGLALYGAATVLGSGGCASKEDALADEYIRLLSRGRTETLSGAGRELWLAAAPALASGNRSAQRVLGSATGRKQVHDWIAREKQRPDGVSGPTLCSLEKACALMER